MKLVIKTESVLETKREAGTEKSNAYKPLELIKPISHAENARNEQEKYPYEVYTLTLFLTSCRGFT